MKTNARVVIITGAGKGLGRAYAHYLASQGMAIIVNNRRHASDEEASADRVVREITEAGGVAVADYGAAEDPKTGDALLAQALCHFGRLDAVIANAGVSEAASFCKQTPESIKRNIEINLLGTAYLLLPTFRHLYGCGGGHVLLSTSAAGLFGGHGLPAYSAAKAGLIGLMHSLALEGRPHDVFVNAIAPFARTQMTAGALDESAVGDLLPDNVAPIAASLIAPDCKVHGEILVAAGERLARAKMLCSEPRSTQVAGSALDALLGEITGLKVEQEHSDAVGMFQSFLSQPLA